MSNPGQQYTDIRRFSDGGGPDPMTQARQKYGDDFYAYPASFGNIAPGGTAAFNVQIQQDAAFEWIESTAYGNLHGAATPLQDNELLPLTIQITDSGSGRSLFFSPVPIGTVSGTGKQPFILPVSKVFVPLATINCVVTSFDAASTFDNIWYIFIGRRVFPYGAGGHGG